MLSTQSNTTHTDTHTHSYKSGCFYQALVRGETSKDGWDRRLDTVEKKILKLEGRKKNITEA